MNIIRGFPAHGIEPPLPPMPVRCFPPPSNAVYDRALKEHFIERRVERNKEEREAQRLRIVGIRENWFRGMKSGRRENWRIGIENMGYEKMGGMGEGTKREDAETEALQSGQIKEKGPAKYKGESEDTGHSMNTPKINLTKGDNLAQNINTCRPTWINTAPGIRGTILAADERSHDFIADINTHGSKLALCTVCNKRHIPPGPPITLADRDTCGSFLPKWFPTHLVARPWDTYRSLTNELVALEGQKGDDDDVASDPETPRWDLEWHEASSEWIAAGRKEGWRRYRKGVVASEVERKCRVCHKESIDGERRRTVGEEEEMRKERKKVLQEFIDRQVRVFGEVDREIARARVQLESMGLMKFGRGKESVEQGVRREGAETMDKDIEDIEEIEEILGSTTKRETEECSTSGSDSEDSELDTHEDSSAKKRVF